jgi:hypothetical protein
MKTWYECMVTGAVRAILSNVFKCGMQRHELEDAVIRVVVKYTLYPLSVITIER